MALEISIKRSIGLEYFGIIASLTNGYVCISDLFGNRLFEHRIGTKNSFKGQFSPCGKYYACVEDFYKGSIDIIGTSGRSVRRLGRTSNVVEDMAWSQDGRYFAVSNYDLLIDIYKRGVENWYGINRLEGHSEDAIVIKWGPFNKYLAAGTRDGRLILWHLEKGLLFSHLAHDGSIKDIAWHPEGQMICTTGDDQSIRMWDVSGEHRQSFPYQGTPIEHLLWDPKGYFLITAGKDRCVESWYIPTGACSKLSEHPLSISALLWKAKQFLLATGEDHQLYVWDFAKVRAKLYQNCYNLILRH